MADALRKRVHTTSDARASADDAFAAVVADYENGGSIAWDSFFPRAGVVVYLPAYPWQRRRYWIDAVARVVPDHPPLPTPARSPASDIGSDDIRSALHALVARTLSIEPASLDPAVSFIAHGLDSFMALELEVDLATITPVPVSVPELLAGMTLDQLVARACSGAPAENSTPAPSLDADLVAALGGLSDDEVRALLDEAAADG